jgi:hypothetical protein
MRIRPVLLGLMVAAGGLNGAAQANFSLGLASHITAPQLSSQLATSALPPIESPSRLAALSTMVSQEDTPFFSETRLPFGELLAGRIECAAFERDLAMRNLFEGLPDSTLVRKMTMGTLTPQGDQLYGFRLSFRLGSSSQTSGAHSRNPLKILLSAFR